MKNSNTEQIFRMQSPTSISIDENAMKALKIACDEFLKTGEQISYFNINISDQCDGLENTAGGIFMVAFIGKLFPGKRGFGTANRAPGSVTYFISKATWEIIKEQGLK